VELLESKGALQQGDRIHLSGREFTIPKAAERCDLTEVPRVETADGAAVQHPNGRRLPAAPLPLPMPVNRSPHGGTRLRRDQGSPQP
jgi:hypothetical protein